MRDFDRTLGELASEGLILEEDGMMQLTEQGAKLGKEWQSLLLRKEPIIEVVAGLVDGSITGLVGYPFSLHCRLDGEGCCFCRVPDVMIRCRNQLLEFSPRRDN